MLKLRHLFCLLLVGASTAAASDVAPSAQSLEYFEKRVRPLLASSCFNCHSASTNSKGGLRTDDRNGLLSGGGRGAAVVPGQPDESLLIQAVRQTGAILDHQARLYSPSRPAEGVADKPECNNRVTCCLSVMTFPI